MTPGECIEFFDCNAYAGVGLFPPLEPALVPAALLQEMDNCGVDRALVNHDGGDFSHPLESNEEITAFCQGSERLLPVWNILPPQTEMRVDDLLEGMRDHGVAALRARPDAHRYLLNEVTMGTVLGELVDRRIPLFVNVEEGWQLLYDVLDSHPDLVLIATDHGCWGDDRFFRPLLERYRHFHIDTSRYELDGGLEDVVKTYGSRQMLFGSSYHHVPMGGSSLLVRHAEIGKDDRAAIAAGNLERILGGVRL